MNETSISLNGNGLPLTIIGFAVLGLFIVWLYALVSALKNERLDSTMKLTWALVIIFASGIGAFIYLFVAPNRPTREERSFENHLRRQKRQVQQTHRQRSIPGLPPEVGS